MRMLVWAFASQYRADDKSDALITCAHVSSFPEVRTQSMFGWH